MDYSEAYRGVVPIAILGSLACGFIGFLLGYVKGIMTKVKILDMKIEHKSIRREHIINTVSVISLIFILCLFVSKLKVKELPIYLIILFAGFGIERIKKVL